MAEDKCEIKKHISVTPRSMVAGTEKAKSEWEELVLWNGTSSAARTLAPIRQAESRLGFLSKRLICRREFRIKILNLIVDNLPYVPDEMRAIYEHLFLSWQLGFWATRFCGERCTGGSVCLSEMKLGLTNKALKLMEYFDEEQRSGTFDKGRDKRILWKRKWFGPWNCFWRIVGYGSAC